MFIQYHTWQHVVNPQNIVTNKKWHHYILWSQVVQYLQSFKEDMHGHAATWTPINILKLPLLSDDKIKHAIAIVNRAFHNFTSWMFYRYCRQKTLMKIT